MAESTILSMNEMMDYTNDELIARLSKVCAKAELSITRVELTLARLLGESIGDSSKNEEEIRIQIEATATFMLAVARSFNEYKNNPSLHEVN